MEELEITLPEQDDRIRTYLPEPDIKNFNKLKEEYGFGSSAEAARTFLNLGMMSIVDNDPRHSVSKADSGEFDPVTIRELVPEGEDNAVEVTEEFWDEVLRNQMLDIVEEDPEIHRSGLNIYR